MSADMIDVIPVSEISIRDDRLRSVDESAVTALRNDIEANGLNQPIMVRTLKNGRFELIDGGHRLEAVVLLGWTEVRALVTRCSVEDARLRTALANLTRAELTMLDRALHVWRVKSVWMKQHPERQHGGFRKEGECQVAAAATWTEAIPGKAGVSDRTLADSAKIGKEIYGPAATLLVGTETADSQKELLALIKYGPDLQRAIAEKIAAGEASSVAQGAALVAGEPEVEELISPVVKQVNKMWTSWEKMEDEAKQQFIMKLKGEGFI